MHRLIAVVIVLCAAVPVHAQSDAVFDGVIAGERVTISFDELSKRAPLAAGEDFVVENLGRDEHTSHHIVSIRNREVPHRHDHHDLVVVMLRGDGAMLMGDQERPVGPGSILYVPRGTNHAFRNTSDQPAVAYAIYSPAFDPSDRVTTGPETED